MATFFSARSIRVCPGFCLAPAVTTTTSASAQTATSSDPSTDAIGTNCMPWTRSSTSASTFWRLVSYRAICLPTPRIRQA